MAKRTRFAPKSRQQSERELSFEQDDFTYGVYNDIPASKIPSSKTSRKSGKQGLYYLENKIAFDYGVAGRTGNKLLNGTNQAKLPTIATGISASKTDKYITIGNPPAVSFIGSDIDSSGIDSVAIFNIRQNVLTGTQVTYSFNAGNIYKGLVKTPTPSLTYWDDTVTYYAVNIDSTHIKISTTSDGLNPIGVFATAFADQYSFTFNTIAYTLTSADIGRFFNWGNGFLDPIIEISANTIITNNSNIQTATTDGVIQGGVKAYEWHPVALKWIMQIDSRIFLSDSWNINSWTEVVKNSKNAPNETNSLIKIFDNNAILFNSAGIFNIELDGQTTPYYHIVNAPTSPMFDSSLEQVVAPVLSIDFSNFNTNINNIEAPGTSVFSVGKYIATGVPFVFTNLNSSAIISNMGGINLSESTTYYAVNYNNTSIQISTALVDGTILDLSYWGANDSLTFSFKAYGRRYVNSYSKIGGVGQLRNRGLASLSDVLHESGTNKINTQNKDFIELWSYDPVGQTGDFVFPLTPPDEVVGAGGRHFDHYSLYGTLDVGPYGTDPSIGSGNNPERYWWIDDVPFVKVFHFSSDGDPCTNTLAAVEAGIFASYDTNSIVPYFTDSTSGSIEIISVFSDMRIEVTNSSGVSGIGAIGAGSVMRGTQTGKIIYRFTGSIGSRPSVNDIGKTVWFSDGSSDIITGVFVGATASLDQVFVSKGASRPDVVLGWNPVSRNYYDLTSDALLEVRNGFLLRQRFMEPLPNCNTGELGPGFLFGIVEGQTSMYYGETSDKSLVGYCHPGHQINVCQSPLTCLSAFPGILIGYQTNGFVSWDIKNTIQMSNTTSGGEDIGEQPITVILTRTETKGIGILDSGALVKTLEGYDLVLTQNREIRTHNGTKFSDNLIADRIQKKLNKFQASSAMHYDKITGLLVYGTEQAAV